eukprot:7391699-Prymnesium_polylepis.3
MNAIRVSSAVACTVRNGGIPVRNSAQTLFRAEMAIAAASRSSKLSVKTSAISRRSLTPSCTGMSPLIRAPCCLVRSFSLT